jgi:cytochrome c-type biogenesis protein CcmH/NrfF
MERETGSSRMTIQLAAPRPQKGRGRIADMTTIEKTLAVTLILLVGLAASASAQSTGPSHAGYDPNATIGGHYHEGELGEKLMVLESALKCNCGCGLDVHSCQFQMQCGTSPVWSQRIRESLEAGESVEAIQASFVAQFGTEVLMLPPPEGFNLLGYLLPGMAIVTAGVFVGVIARGNATRASLAPAHEVSDADEARLRAAMQKLDADESPDW